VQAEVAELSLCGLLRFWKASSKFPLCFLVGELTQNLASSDEKEGG